MANSGLSEGIGGASPISLATSGGGNLLLLGDSANTSTCFCHQIPNQELGLLHQTGFS